uniref:Uncharacterized protein n=1 Tax=viral metagenome TaxID=1070528 RepID=A0A6M3LNS8_9ZZZZ
MTRANINYVYQIVGEAPKTLFLYHNGDQYPSGMRDCFNVLDLVKETITPNRFKKWLKENYVKEHGDKLKDLGEGGQPKIYYTNGFITDYSYVFEDDEVSVWNYKELIFEGNREKFINWIKKQ